MKQTTIILILLVFGISSCNKSIQQANNSFQNTIYKLGRKTDSTSTGPRKNSAFILKVNDSMPSLLLTAHHIVAGTDTGQFLKWNELEDKRNLWAWSMTDSTVDFKVGKNLPIRNAETLKLDLAAFYLTTDNNVPYLRPSQKAAQVGDTVYLYSKVTFKNTTTLMNRGVVIYATDSVMVYELTDFKGKVQGILSGTSGSCVLDKDNYAVANSYAGLAIPNEDIKKKMAMGYPLINKLTLRDSMTYGIGIPIDLIEKSLVRAYRDEAH